MRTEPGFVVPGALEAAPEVVAAIAVAPELCWPRPAPPARQRSFVGRDGRPEYVWRLSGRWWNRPIPLRRDRPWADR